MGREAANSTLVLVSTFALLSLAAVAIPSLVMAGGGCHGPVNPPGDGESSVIKIDGCMFYPTVAHVPVGTTVEFLNTGTVPHNVTGVIGTWGSGDMQTGDKFRQTFAAPGVYPFACTFHPGMNGAIVVGEATAEMEPAGLVTPPPPAATGSSLDPTMLAVVGFAGLGIGAVLGVIGAGVVRRGHATD